MMKKLLLSLSAVAAAGTAQANLLAYEGFGGYTPGTAIETQAGGGSGWSTGWFPANTNATVDDYFLAGASSLSNGAFAGTGLSNAAGSTFYDVGDPGIAINPHNTIRRTMNTSFNGNTGGTFYFSFLVDGSSFANGNIFRYSIEMDSATGRRIYLENLADGNLQYRIAGAPGGGSGNPQLTATTAASPFSAAGTYFIVGKVELTSGAGNLGDGLDNFYAQVFADSDIVGMEPGSWTLSALGSSLNAVNEFNQVSLISSIANQYAFDELRVGTTWESVTGVPEPSTYALMFGCMAIGLAIWRRKQR